MIKIRTGFLADTTKTGFLKRAFKTGIFQQFGKSPASALFRISHIIPPGIRKVLPDLFPEFKSNRLCKTIIYIVERHGIDMMLALPAFPFGLERNISVQLHPGHINPKQFLPDGMALRRGHFRLFIDDMLKMINHRPIRNESQ